MVYTVRKHTDVVHVREQGGFLWDALIELEDETGVWLFDSDDIIAWDLGVGGSALTVPKPTKRGKVHHG